LFFLSKKNIDIPSNQTKGTIKTPNPKYMTITWNKETKITTRRPLIFEIF